MMVPNERAKPSCTSEAGAGAGIEPARLAAGDFEFPASISNT